MDELQNLINDKDSIVSQTAMDVYVLREELDEGNLTKAQFEELVEDLLQADEVRRMSDKLERKIRILQAFNAIRTIVGIALK